jgi:threonine dehydrogenase-like Zn-dependent dehydrogenase
VNHLRHSKLIAIRDDKSALAKQIGALPIDTKDGEIGEQIRDLTGGLGADCGAECVGYQCHNAAGKEIPNLVMNSLVDGVKATGSLGIIGVFVPQDPGARVALAKKARSPVRRFIRRNWSLEVTVAKCMVVNWVRFVKSLGLI